MLTWLGIGTPSATIGLRPHRSVVLERSYNDAFAQVLRAIDLTLGANVSVRDRDSGYIEAGFGVVNNERVRCIFERGETATTVHIEAHFRAGAAVTERSNAVDALASALKKD